MTERLPEPVAWLHDDGFWTHNSALPEGRALSSRLSLAGSPRVGVHLSAQPDADNAALARWKSTNAPRLEALEGLLKHAQIEAAKGAEAIASLASERAANAILTGEVEALRASRDELREFHDAAMVEAGRLLGMENPEEEPRFKWVALGISEVVRDRDALRERVKVLEDVLRGTARELQACQSVIHLAGGFDPLYVSDAQFALNAARAALEAK